MTPPNPHNNLNPPNALLNRRQRDREREENRSDYQSFVPVLAERAPENSLYVAKVSVAEMRGADDNVVTLHGAAAASSTAAAASRHPAPAAAARRGPGRLG